MTDHNGLPVKGYAPTQSEYNIGIVNVFKELEERFLRAFDLIEKETRENDPKQADLRWLALARTHIQMGTSFAARSIFQPGRISLPEDDQ